MRSGELHAEHTLLHGFEKVPEAFVGLFSGRNKGKMLVAVNSVGVGGVDDFAGRDGDEL